MKVSDLVQTLESLAPTRFAEPWDNVGLLIGDAEAPLYGALLTIDFGPQELEEAKKSGCNAVVAYHPPIFKNLRRLLPGMIPFEAVRAQIAVVSPHTALDVAIGGTNDALAHNILGLVKVTALRSASESPGMGRVGEFSSPVDRAVVLAQIKDKLGVDRVLVAGPTTGMIKRAAVCAGSCGDIVEEARGMGVDLYLTGEMRHHDALQAARDGMTVVCVLHSNSERHVLAALRSTLIDRLGGVNVIVSEVDADPFTII